MFGLQPNQLYGLAAIGVAVIGYLALTYRQELSGAAGWLGGWFKSKPPVSDPDAAFNSAVNACDQLMLFPDPEVKRLAALAARRVTEVTYPVGGGA